MKDVDIGRTYIRYIGAGAVAAGGIISVFKSLPLILSSIQAGLRDIRRIRGAGGSEEARGPRTERDLPLLVVGGGSLALVGLILLTRVLHQVLDWVPDLHMNPVGAVLIVLFGFLFVTVSSRLTGEIGSSSNPISGMTVATLLLTCLIFLALGWTNPEDRLTALSVAGVVCVAASNGGTTSQDLKTGFLVGATPKWQQIAITVGALSSALVIGWILVGLNEASTVYTAAPKNLPTLKQPLDVPSLTQMEKAPGNDALFHVWQAPEGNIQKVPRGKYLVDDEGRIRYLVDPGINGKISRRDDGSEVRKYDAPQASLMYLVTDGILTQKLPWPLVLLGVSIAIVLELCGVGSLAFAVGVYLPLSTTAPVFVGGLVRYLAERWARRQSDQQHSEAESDTSPGVLLSTGYIAGGTLAGVLIAFLNFSEDIPKKLSIWQYSTYELRQERPLDDAYREAAAYDLGLTAKEEELTSDQEEDVKELAGDIAALNEGLVPQYASVPEGTVLKLPGNTTHRAEQSDFLGHYANQLLGSADKAPLIFDLNEDQLKAPTALPAGTKMKLPQHNAPALLLFAVLMVFLTLVGLGWLLQSSPAEKGDRPPASQHLPDAES
jgi:hypothetical protein